MRPARCWLTHEWDEVKHIPVIYPLSLVVIILVTFFAGAYAISEGAFKDTSPIYAATAPTFETDAGPAALGGATQHDWYETAAVWICPLH